MTMRAVARDAVVSGLMGIAAAFFVIFYIEFFEGYHIVECSDKPSHWVAVTRWNWAKSWISPVDCDSFWPQGNDRRNEGV